MSDDDGDFRQREIEQVQGFLRPWLALAEKIYSQAMNSLWLGNAGASLTTLSFIGAAWKNGTFPKILLAPLAFFLTGLISMGIGTVSAIMRVRAAIERNQLAESPLDIRMDDIQSPLERVGLSGSDRRTVMALFSGGCFVAGCVVGFILLACR
jgi:hypothetical protein